MPKIFDKEVLRQKIHETRIRKEMNQSQLAEKAGITPAAVSQIEKGLRVPTTPVLHKIAGVLEVSLDYLTGKTDDSRIQDMMQNDDVMTFFRGYQSLDPDDRDTILKNIEFLQFKLEKGKEK